MEIDVNKQIAYWLTTAEKDLDFAREVLTHGKNLHYCLFFCHLVIEKSLKALVVKATREHPVRSHDLEFLAEKAHLNLSEGDMNFLNEMTEFNIEARYPDEKFEVYHKATPELTRQLFERTIQFSSWIRERVKQ